MKFFVLLAFGVVFFTIFARAQYTDYAESEEEEEEDEDDEDDEPQAMNSAMQLNGNNVGDINNIKGTIKIQSISSGSAETWAFALIIDQLIIRIYFVVNWNGELHNMMNQDIFSVILGLLNNQQITENGDDDDDEDDEYEYHH